jgi:hypothetical protein
VAPDGEHRPCLYAPLWDRRQVSTWISRVQWVIAAVRIGGARNRDQRVARQELACSWVVVAGAEVVAPGGRVLVLPGPAQRRIGAAGLAGELPVGAVAVGGGDRAGAAGEQSRGAELVVVVVADGARAADLLDGKIVGAVDVAGLSIGE